MEQSTDLLASATEDELIVADILLNLPQIITISESKSKLKSQSSWGSKKKRSGLNASPLNYLAPALPPPSPSVQMTEDKIEQTRPQIKPEEDGGAAPTAAGSPNTPFFFSFTESDENKNNHSIKESSKKKEIENVRKHYNKLMAENSELKSMQQEVLKILAEKESQQVEELTQVDKVINQQPLISDQTSDERLDSLDPSTTQLQLFSNGSGPDKVRWIPDLNIPVEED